MFTGGIDVMGFVKIQKKAIIYSHKVTEKKVCLDYNTFSEKRGLLTGLQSK